MNSRNQAVSFKNIALIYIATLLLYIICSFFPDLRVWGFSIFAHFPIYIPIIMSVVGLVALWLVWKQRGVSSENQDISSKTYWLIAGLTTITFGVLFYLFKAKTFFLGDGYTLLSLVGSEDPLLKTREIGEVYSHYWLKELIGIGGEQGALLSFQIISIFTGIVFVVTTFMFSNKIFEQTKDKLLFAFGILSGCYMLLSFGYVEYYSIFVLTVLIYTFIGLLVALKKISSSSLERIRKLLFIFETVR